MGRLRRQAPLTLAVFGMGRVGRTLVAALRDVHRVAVIPRSPHSRRAARALKVPLLEGPVSADLCFICTPDRTLVDSVRTLQTRLSPKTALIHCAGSLGLDVLQTPTGHARGILHPLVAVSGNPQTLQGCWASVSASTPRLQRHLLGLAGDLGLQGFPLAEQNRTAYHAAAVMSAGLVATLVHEAVEVWAANGIPRVLAHRALPQLARSALETFERPDTRNGLTGPAVRGDLATILRHERALSAGPRRVYKLLTQQMNQWLGGSPRRRKS